MDAHDLLRKLKSAGVSSERWKCSIAISSYCNWLILDLVEAVRIDICLLMQPWISSIFASMDDSRSVTNDIAVLKFRNTPRKLTKLQAGTYIFDNYFAWQWRCILLLTSLKEGPSWSKSFASELRQIGVQGLSSPGITVTTDSK